MEVLAYTWLQLSPISICTRVPVGHPNNWTGTFKVEKPQNRAQHYQMDFQETKSTVTLNVTHSALQGYFIN